MNIKGIISISGKPGLHKVVSQTKNGLIAESLIDSKRFPVYSTQQISALEDISIYTTDEDILLSEVFESLKKVENGKPTLSHKSSANELAAKLEEALPNYDKERVYASDIKKLIQWYNILAEQGLLDAEEEKDTNEASTDSKKTKKTASASKTVDAKKKVAKTAKEETKKAAPKKVAAKTKAQPKKSTGSK